MSKGDKKDTKEREAISSANLPKELVIEDPKVYIRMMRTTFLRKVRETRNMSFDEACKKSGIKSDDLRRIESGQVNEQDMMALSKVCDLYGIDYANVLYLFKLAQRPERQNVEKMAAYHDQKMDEQTQKELIEFLSKLQG